MLILKKIAWILFYRKFLEVRQQFETYKQYCAYKRRSKTAGLVEPKWKDRYFVNNENTTNTGFEPHYTYHPAWAARRLFVIKPEVHYDISSAIFFSVITSAFIPIKFFDFRPPSIKLNNLDCGFADLTCLPFADNSIHSLSCMHVIEHIGLGRYGDPINPLGDVLALKELKRVLAERGHLLLVLPIGKRKVIFNAHRIYSYAQIMNEFLDGWDVIDYMLIPDNAEIEGIIESANEEISDKQNYGCGCFHFQKKSLLNS